MSKLWERIDKVVINDLEHLAKCNRCMGVFDMRVLSDVLKHEKCDTNHKLYNDKWENYERSIL